MLQKSEKRFYQPITKEKIPENEFETQDEQLITSS